MTKLTKYEKERRTNLYEANQRTLNELRRIDNTTICYTVKELTLVIIACVIGGVLIGWSLPLT